MVSAEILIDASSGRSRGSGIVEFTAADQSTTAIAKFSGYMYGGRPLEVRYNFRSVSPPPRSHSLFLFMSCFVQRRGLVTDVALRLRLRPLSEGNRFHAFTPSAGRGGMPAAE